MLLYKNKNRVSYILAFKVESIILKLHFNVFYYNNIFLIYNIRKMLNL